MAQLHEYLFIKALPLFLILRLTTVSAHDQPLDSAGLLCISECFTCPTICAPPPPPSQYKLNPPSSTFLPLPSPPPPSPPKSPKHASPPPPRTPPPPRFIYTFGVPPPPKVYYGVLPAPPYVKGKPNDYENPYAYSSGFSCCSGIVHLLTVVAILHMFVMRIFV